MYEKSDINVRVIVGFGAALVVALGLVFLLIWLLFGLYGNLNARTSPREFPLAPSDQLRLPSEPRLQEKPREELEAFRRKEDAVLNGYTWIDQRTGAVRIPIDRAIERLLDQGLPVRENAPAEEPARPSQSNSGRRNDR